MESQDAVLQSLRKIGLQPPGGMMRLIVQQSNCSRIGARSETAHEKPSFRDAWRNQQHCINPAEAIFEPDWRSGKSVATRITRADGEPMGIAGLWSWWKLLQAEMAHSYMMLSINADAHALMRHLHEPSDEILPEAAYGRWLHAPAQHSMQFLRPFPAERLLAMVSDD